MHEQPLQEIVPPFQVDPPHSTGFIQVSHTAFRKLAPLPLESFAAFAADASPIGVYLLLLVLLSLPVSLTPIGFGDVAAAAGSSQVLQYRPAMVALVAHYFLEPTEVNLRLGLRESGSFVCDQLPYRFACFRQRLVNGRGVSLIRSLHGHRQQRPAAQI